MGVWHPLDHTAAYRRDGVTKQADIPYPDLFADRGAPAGPALRKAACLVGAVS